MNKYKVKESLADIPLENFIDALLNDRGVISDDDKQDFLSPSFDNGLGNPLLLSDMQKAVDRIFEAVDKKEKIAIYADYDADGIPGAVVLHDYFKEINYENVVVYIPNRGYEGFGLKKDAIQKLKDDGVSLIITVDCGINNIEEIEYASQINIDVIVTDHHEPSENLPKAYAIINPKISPEYPEKMLCGAAVAWKLVCALLSKNRLNVRVGFEKWLLDLVGIATLSDMVPLTGENRILAYFGLVVLRKSRRKGLKALLGLLRISQESLSEDDVGFMITPRINAASRMGNAYDAFALLSTKKTDEAIFYAKKLEELNKKRKVQSAVLAREVKKFLLEKNKTDVSVIVLGSPDWKPSLLGTVASKIADEEGKPVFLWGKEEGGLCLKGSCRSAGASVVEIMKSVSKGIFIEYGGHHGAGGFSVSYESIHLLEDALTQAFDGEKDNASFVSVDKSILPADVTKEFLLEIEKLAPFGVSHEKPLFIIQSVSPKQVQKFGKEKLHLKFNFTHAGKDIEAMAFFASEDIVEKASTQSMFSVVGHIERGFLGRGVRVRIVDII